VLQLGNHADAGPAFGLHFIEVFQAGEVGSSIGSSSFSSLFADGVGKSEIVNACDLHGFSALLGSSEAGEECNECKNNDLHSR